MSEVLMTANTNTHSHRSVLWQISEVLMTETQTHTFREYQNPIVNVQSAKDTIHTNTHTLTQSTENLRQMHRVLRHWTHKLEKYGTIFQMH